MNDEIQHILSGKSQVKHGDFIQTILSFLRRSEATSDLVKEDKHFKEKETAHLVNYISEEKFWIENINLTNYISQGAEQKVYLQDEKSVIKLNDSIYYTSWKDYLNNLLLNNYFFSDTAYELLGFYRNENVLYAVVEQPFVKATEKTNLELVKQFMESNGFENTRNNDYINKKIGVILEDLHDENVLTQNGILFFIDTVFYII
ncbi:putative polyvalent protein kinase domain-containing protein [Flavobacterium tibetense]|uniref:Uncharacterized protein n=1 Tax=Flavobacterium tibetense TaxID=2233533 RepID=A0A365P122_9FLAO|nr:hypothetical protein [Flavobacterium tibetense]RBA28169.1 hypothetical protein DPN68_08425 [Flavobacterium tibetense]